MIFHNARSKAHRKVAATLLTPTLSEAGAQAQEGLKRKG